jgi:hypothetical protein
MDYANPEPQRFHPEGSTNLRASKAAEPATFYQGRARALDRRVVGEYRVRHASQPVIPRANRTGLSQESTSQ